jgi:hypothetical protein
MDNLRLKLRPACKQFKGKKQELYGGRTDLDGMIKMVIVMVGVMVR